MIAVRHGRTSLIGSDVRLIAPLGPGGPRLPEKRGLTLILPCVPANNECKAGATAASPQRRGRHAADAFARPRLQPIIVNSEFYRAPRRAGRPERLGGWRTRRGRVELRSDLVARARSVYRPRFTYTSYPQFPQRVGSDFWTQNNSLNARLTVSPSFQANLSRRTCAPTAPAFSRSYGRRSRGALTCSLGVQDGCRARRVTSDRDAGSNSIVHAPEYPGVYLDCGVWSRSTSCLSPEGRSF